MQLSLFDRMHEPKIRTPVDPDGRVVQGDIDELHECPHPRGKGLPVATIQVRRDEASGYWMWAINHPNGGYRVGPKWGKFAVTPFDARFYAARELIALVTHRNSDFARHICDWAMAVAEMSPGDLNVGVAP